jgi:glycerate 2-kinase
MIFRDNLFRGKPNEELRRRAAAIFEAAVRAVDPAAAVRRHVSLDRTTLRIDSRTYDLGRIQRMFLVGAGKASAPMAKALEDLLGERITTGVVNVKYGYTVPLDRVSLVEAGHPIPDEAGRRGAERILQLVAQAGRDDLVLCVISGGGSALLPAPVEGVSLVEKARVTDLLLKSGATIEEVNAVRKHLSKIKGGQLAKAAAQAEMAVLILSDVVGNALDAIASGPAVPDPTTFGDARDVLARYGLIDEMPSSVRDYLKRGVAGMVPETPKPGNPMFDRVHTVIVGSNDVAVQAAARSAQASGLQTVVLPTVTGEARDAAEMFTDRALRFADGARPACVLAGGETTVTVRGGGTGGRCQEFALAAAMKISERPRTLIGAFGTDGNDGPTDAAGAVVDGTTAARAAAAGLDGRRALDENDAYGFFSKLSDLIVTGPTNTNVNDIYLALVGAQG